MLGKSVTVLNSYRDYFNGRSGLIREIKGDIISVQLIGSKMLTKFKITDLKIN
jgi:hypothetical protein